MPIVKNKLLENLYEDLRELFSNKDEETGNLGYAFTGVTIYENPVENQILITYNGTGYEYLSKSALAGGIMRKQLYEIAKDNGFIIENLSEFSDVFHLSN
jgi:hypothetical protein